MNRCFFLIGVLLLFAQNSPAQPNGKIQKSLVRITATEVEPDYRAPWNSGAIQRGVGAGFVIDGSRILTKRLRSRDRKRSFAEFFQGHGPAHAWGNSAARVNCFGLWLSDRRRAHVGHNWNCFAD